VVREYYIEEDFRLDDYITTQLLHALLSKTVVDIEPDLVELKNQLFCSCVHSSDVASSKPTMEPKKGPSKE
jgi:hypothetical protein